MQFFALITVTDQDPEETDGLLETIADRVRTAVNEVVPVETVQVGTLMSMDEALADIKRNLGAIPGDHDYTEPS